MFDLKPLLAFGHSLGVARELGESDSDLAHRIQAEVARLRVRERSTRRKRRLGWAFRAALAAAGIGLVGF